MQTRSNIKSWLHGLVTLTVFIWLAAAVSARADDTNANDTATSSQSSASYDETMKWIQSKLETWTTHLFGVTTNNETGQITYTFGKVELADFDSYGNLHFKQTDWDSNYPLPNTTPTNTHTIPFKVDLSTLFETNVTVAFYAGHTKTIDAHEARGVHLPSLSIYWTKNYSVLPWNLHFDDKDTAERMANAFRHAIAQLKKNQPF